MKTRIAPTPSGYLHLGNAFNFILTAWAAQNLNLELQLRIDDADATRMRPEFLEDIFNTLDWLEIKIDSGPSGVDNFLKNYSQTLRKDKYFKELLKLDEIYACDCTRAQIKKLSPDGPYPKICTNEAKKFDSLTHQLRLNVSDSELQSIMGDFVLWRKEDIPAYQWTSFIDDRDDKITHIYRGEDLLESTQAQRYISSLYKDDPLSKIKYFHHPLLLGDNDKKLSKSQGSTSLQEDRSPSFKKNLFKSFGKFYGLGGISDINDLKGREFPLLNELEIK